MKKLLVFLLLIGVVYSQDDQPNILTKRSEVVAMVRDSLAHQLKKVYGVIVNGSVTKWNVFGFNTDPTYSISGDTLIVSSSAELDLEGLVGTNNLDYTIVGTPTTSQLKIEWGGFTGKTISFIWQYDTLSTGFAEYAGTSNTYNNFDTTTFRAYSDVKYQTASQVRAIVSDSMATKLDADFSTYDAYTTPTDADILIVQKEGTTDLAKVELASLPVSTDAQSSIDNLSNSISTTLTQNYATKSEYNELLLRVDALEDSITALRSSIGYITPTFPTTPTNLVASSDGTNIDLIWNKFHINPAADSFAVFYTTVNPNQFEGNWATLDYVTDSVFQHSGVSTNTVYWYHVKAIIGTTFSNASNTDSAYVYEAPAVNNWLYVSQDGLGDKTGVDSANAFAISGITGISAGDTLIFLGGTYTTGLTINFSGTAANPIVLRSSYKNGAVFTGVTTAFSINDSYLKFENFKFTRCGVAFDLRSGSTVIYTDSNYVTKGTGQGALAFMSGTTGSIGSIDSIFIRYNIAITDSQTTNQTDIIYGQRGIDNIFIIGNQLDQENTTGTQHNDNIQIYNAANDVGDVIVANNKIKNLKTSDSQGMMGNTSAAGYKTILYNNVVYMAGTSHGLWSYVPDASQGDVYAIHNTLYTNSASGKGPLFVQGDNITVKNNVIRNAGLVAVYYDTLYTNDFDCDYNLYYSSDARYPVGLGYGMNIWGKTLAYWKAYWLGQDANSINVDPLFTSTSNSYTGLTLQAGSPAKNAGTNLQTLIESFGLEWKTINGTNRDSTPDLGAY